MSEDVRAYDPGGTAISAAGRSVGQPATPDLTPATDPAPANNPSSPEETVRLFEEGVRAHSSRLLAIARAVLGRTSARALKTLFSRR